MTHIQRPILSPCAALVLLGAAISPSAGLAAGSARAIEFVPHRAIYDVSLERTSAGSAVTDLTGRLVYEITGSACEGYTQNMRFVTRTSNQEGQTQMTDLRTSSWEDVPSRRLRFSTTNYQNDTIAEQSQGDARRLDPLAAVTSTLVKPSKKKADIAAGVYFPVQHSMALIEAARAGKSLFTAELYDGSETGEKVFSTSAAIGRIAVAGAVKMPVLAKNADKLALVPSWPVSISYFEGKGDKRDVTPAYEMSYRFYENGVTTGLVIDHGEFAFRGELKELEFLPQSKCEPAAQ